MFNLGTTGMCTRFHWHCLMGSGGDVTVENFIYWYVFFIAYTCQTSLIDDVQNKTVTQNGQSAHC